MSALLLRRVIVRLLLTLVYLLVCAHSTAATPRQTLEEFKRPVDIPTRGTESISSEQLTLLRELGRTLFFDPRLSRSGLMSCATCHNPSLHWTDGLKASVENASRRSMCLYNLAWDRGFTWRGGPGSVMSQSILALTAPTGMNTNESVVKNGIAKIPYYQETFPKAFKGLSPNAHTMLLEHITYALEVYISTIVSPIAPFDRWVDGDQKALTEAQVRGFEIFRGKAGCVKCHAGWRFSDGGYYDIGLRSGDTERDAKGNPHPFFKAVGLRNIADRPPYMHDGSLETLEAVVDFYNRGGDSTRPTKSPRIKPLGLTATEKDDLVKFLRSLSGAPTPEPLPILPR
jgi:cytochrome c peroxidase